MNDLLNNGLGSRMNYALRQLYFYVGFNFAALAAIVTFPSQRGPARVVVSARTKEGRNGGQKA